jgi:hypothetical protein
MQEDDDPVVQEVQKHIVNTSLKLFLSLYLIRRLTVAQRALVWLYHT